MARGVSGKRDVSELQAGLEADIKSFEVADGSVEERVVLKG